MRRQQAALRVAVGVCLAWAAVEARHLETAQARTPASASSTADPAAVEASFAEVLRERDAGRNDEAALGLRERTTRGPHPGQAWFLLGELAYEEGVYPAAVRHYRRAVETDPSVADRRAAFSASRVLAARLREIREGPWRKAPPPEIRDLYYLQRRLAGGCQ